VPNLYFSYLYEVQKIIVIFFFLLCFSAKSQSDTVIIKNTSFKISKQKIYDGDGSYYKRIALYRIENDKSKKLLTHNTYRSDGDCNSAWVEIGDYEINDSGFVFYTYWARAGDASSHPCGVRKQMYAVDTAGKLKLSKCELSFTEYGFIEDASIGYDPTDISTVRAFKKYYNGVFLKGDKAEKLKEEVRIKLRDPIEKNGESWEKIAAIEGNSWAPDGFGMCW
jgi:hypothetical protein